MKTIQTKPGVTIGLIDVELDCKDFKIKRLAHTVLIKLSTEVTDNDLDYYALEYEKGIKTIPVDKEPFIIGRPNH